MVHDIYDLRIRVLHRLSEMSSRNAYLSGVLTGLKVQSRLMKEIGRTYYSSDIVDFFLHFHNEPFAVLVKDYNLSQIGSDKVTLVAEDFFVGGSYLNTVLIDEYLAGMEDSMVYVAGLYHALSKDGDEKAKTINLALDYLPCVIEWVDEALNLRPHIHKQ
ncbi:hypothetical protein HGB07_10245 [Candidatus Roizmanbacteria bacterium]|nr:hypothetical protein [Candidatus Roizmanbacteria bacterium]